MRKSRAIVLLIALVVAIGGYVAWAAWNPAPTLQSMTFSKNVDDDARSAAEADFHSHPPKARRLTWQRFMNRLANPYQPRKYPTIEVWIFPHPDGAKILSINYPCYTANLARGRNDGRWSRENVLKEHDEIRLGCVD